MCKSAPSEARSAAAYATAQREDASTMLEQIRVVDPSATPIGPAIVRSKLMLAPGVGARMLGSPGCTDRPLRASEIPGTRVQSENWTFVASLTWTLPEIHTPFTKSWPLPRTSMLPRRTARDPLKIGVVPGCAETIHNALPEGMLIAADPAKWMSNVSKSGTTMTPLAPGFCEFHAATASSNAGVAAKPTTARNGNAAEVSAGRFGDRPYGPPPISAGNP